MRILALPFTPRFIALTLSVLITLALAAAIGASMISAWDAPLFVGLALFGALSLLGSP